MKTFFRTLAAIVLITIPASIYAAAEVKYIDLSQLANHDGVEKLGKSYANLPRETVIYSIRNNTPFIIHQNNAKKIFVLTKGNFLPNTPETVNIPVKDYVNKMSFFGQMHFEVPNNRIIGKYTINYEDNNSIDILLDTNPASPQWNVDDHCCNWRQKDLTKAQLAWEDTSQSEKRALIREFSWENPAPSKKIVSIDFTSFVTSANPVLAAITYLTPDSTTPGPGGSCDIPTIKTNLDIHIPSANYQTLMGTTKLWADFEYAGQNTSGQHLWRLKDFGQQ